MEMGLTKNIYMQMKIKGASDEEIASTLGISRYSLVQLRKLWSIENSWRTLDTYFEYKRIGYSDRLIAKTIFHMTPSALVKWKQKRGIASIDSRKRFTAEELATLKKMLSQGHSLTKSCELMGKNARTFFKNVHELKEQGIL